MIRINNLYDYSMPSTVLFNCMETTADRFRWFLIFATKPFDKHNAKLPNLMHFTFFFSCEKRQVCEEILSKLYSYKGLFYSIKGITCSYDY